MIKLVIGCFLLILLVMFIRGLIKDSKMNSKVEAARERLATIKNEHKVLDIEEKVQEAESKLNERKQSTSSGQ